MIHENIRALARRYHSDNLSYRKIANLLKISPNSVRNIILGNEAERKNKAGRKNKVDRRQQVRILREVGRLEDEGCKISATKIKINCNLDHVSTRTVRRKLAALGLHYDNANQAIQLTSEQKRKQVMFSEQWIDSNWPWERVIWTDEKRFSLDGPDCHKSWSKKGKKQRRNRRQQGGASLQFWGMILPNGELILSELHQRSKSSDYIELLSDFVKPILDSKCGENYLFQQDNCSIHTSKKVYDWMRQNNFRFMTWPSRSPDMSPIENVWSLLSNIVYDRKQFQNVSELRKTILESVAKLNDKFRPQVLNIRNSIRARTRKLIACKGNKLDY